MVVESVAWVSIVGLLVTLIVIVMALAIPIVIVWGIVRIVSGGRGGRAQALDAEEARIMQEIHAGLAKMEERIESLETLLVDKEEKSTL